MSRPEEKADVWLPLYIGDYLADTTRLTTEQHGAYLLLIMDYWRNGPPPDEKIVLQQVTRLTDFLFKKHWPVLQKFFTLIDGHWHHKRIDAEMADALSSKAGASEKARNAAKARWEKENARSIAQAHAPEMLEECPSPSPSPSPVNRSSTEHTHVEPPRVRAKPSEISAAMRKHSVDAQSGDPRVIAAAEAGITVETIEAACAEAKRKKQGQRVNAGFVLSIADSWTQQAATPRPPARASPPQTIHDKRAATIAALTGANRNASPEQPADTIDVAAKRIG